MDTYIYITTAHPKTCSTSVVHDTAGTIVESSQSPLFDSSVRCNLLMGGVCKSSSP